MLGCSHAKCQLYQTTSNLQTGIAEEMQKQEASAELYGMLRTWRAEAEGQAWRTLIGRPVGQCRNREAEGAAGQKRSALAKQWEQRLTRRSGPRWTGQMMLSPTPEDEWILQGRSAGCWCGKGWNSSGFWKPGLRHGQGPLCFPCCSHHRDSLSWTTPYSKMN